METSQDNLTDYYDIYFQNSSVIFDFPTFYLYPEYILPYVLSLICILGIVGNGIVIIFLGFYIKRNSFTVYILNLSMADSGTLIFLLVSGIFFPFRHISLEIAECLIFTYCTGQFLLTIISIDRCLALFFPIWHRYHCPRYLSTIVCVFSWIVSSLLCVINYVLCYDERYEYFPSFNHIFICTSVCVPLMAASSLALFIKGYLKSKMQKRGKLLKVTLLALFFFLIFSILPTAIYLKDVLFKHIIETYDNLIIYGYLCASLNSSVNPLIYFLLGRKKEHKITCNLKNILQRLFKEEEENEEQREVQVDTQTSCTHESGGKSYFSNTCQDVTVNADKSALENPGLPEI